MTTAPLMIVTPESTYVDANSLLVMLAGLTKDASDLLMSATEGYTPDDAPEDVKIKAAYAVTTMELCEHIAKEIVKNAPAAVPTIPTEVPGFGGYL